MRQCNNVEQIALIFEVLTNDKDLLLREHSADCGQLRLFQRVWIVRAAVNLFRAASDTFIHTFLKPLDDGL